MLKYLTSWLLPYTCVLCGYKSYRDQDLCQDCYQELPFADHACNICAIALPPSSTTHTCGKCLQMKHFYDATYSLFFYETPIDRLLLELKFTQSLAHARILGELMAEKMTEWYAHKAMPDLIIPIPLHPQRLKERGYNQAVELARPIAKRHRLTIDLYACQRHKATLPQAQLPAKKREDNIKNAFTTKARFDGKHLAVIDDVITTGSTIHAFCKMLKQHGAKTIDVWCCARPKPL